MEHVQNLKRFKEQVKGIFQSLNKHGIVPNKRILLFMDPAETLLKPSKKGKQA